MQPQTINFKLFIEFVITFYRAKLYIFIHFFGGNNNIAFLFRENELYENLQITNYTI